MYTPVLPISSVANRQPKSQQGSFKGCLSMRTSVALAPKGETEGRAKWGWTPCWNHVYYTENILVAMLMGQDYISLLKIFQHKWGRVVGLLHHAAFWKGWRLLSIYTSSSCTWPLSWWEDASAFYKVVSFAWKTLWDSIRMYNSQISQDFLKIKMSWPYSKHVHPSLYLLLPHSCSTNTRKGKEKKKLHCSTEKKHQSWKVWFRPFFPSKVKLRSTVWRKWQQRKIKLEKIEKEESCFGEVNHLLKIKFKINDEH